MTVQMHSMTIQQLEALKAQIAQEEARRMAEIPMIFGEWFTNNIGKEIIYKVAIVDPKALGLEYDAKHYLRLNYSGKYFLNPIRPAMLGDASAVRGVLGPKQKPFITVKIEVLDRTTRKTKHVFVELIFKRYSKKFPDHYVIATHPTVLGLGVMGDKGITILRDLLAGKEIVVPTDPKCLYRMAR